ncbi:hypothetical protein LguiB_020175 [Lonicera macranthoides]
MAISKILLASLLVSLLAIQLVQTHQELMIVPRNASTGAPNRVGRRCALGPVELAVPVATAYLRVPPGTKRCAPAMPT